MITQRAHHRRWAGLLTRIVAITTLAATTLAAPAAAAPPAPQTAAGPAATGGGQESARQFTPPVLRNSSYVVTLVTGDRVTLSAVGGGNYTVSPDPASLGNPGITVSATGDAHGPHGVYAIPNDAQELVNANVLDRGLFDVQYLVAHKDTGDIPVTVHYGGHPNAAALIARAKTLPGARPDSTDPAAGTVKVSVASAKTRAFWAALTGQRSDRSTQPAPGYPVDKTTPQLALATSAWLTGHRVGTATARPADQPLYQVTQTIKLTDATQMIRCGTFCLQTAHLFAETGARADTMYRPSTVTCNNPCSAWQLSYTVPAGIYAVEGGGYFERPSDIDQKQWVDLAQPQLAVAADTSFTEDLDHAQQITASTPQPTETRRVTIQDFRSLPGSIYYDTNETPGYLHVWALPSGPATVGTFHLSSQWTLDRPEVTMTLAGPQPLALHPQYPTFTDAAWGARHTGSVRFAGRTRLSLVAAGTGTAQDFAGINAHGKLVLLRTPGSCAGWDSSCTAPCIALRQQMDNALQAGAAGVIFDPVYDPSAPGDAGTCATRITQSWDDQTKDPGIAPDLPLVLVSATEAATLRARLSHGAVHIAVADDGDSPYSYVLKFYHEGKIPTSLAETVIAKHLYKVHAAYHVGTASAPQQRDFVGAVEGVYGPGEFLVGSTGDSLVAGSERDEYYGPVSPDNAWFRLSTLSESATGRPVDTRFTTGLFDQRAGAGSETWFEEPVVPGAPDPLTDIHQAQPNHFTPEYCSGCREGNLFFPLSHPVGSNPRQQSLPYDGYYPFWGTTHLYQGGREVPQTLQEGAIISYLLPPAPQRYRLTQDVGNSHTVWNFTSAAPSSDHTPAGYACIANYLGLSSDPCEAAPLIYLRYDASLDLNNTLTAPGAHELRVSAYHQDSRAAAVTSLKLWTSTDGGKNWDPARVSGRDGNYTAYYVVPATADGTVSIKAQADDAAGNDVTQSVADAYGVSLETK